MSAQWFLSMLFSLTDITNNTISDNEGKSQHSFKKFRSRKTSLMLGMENSIWRFYSCPSNHLLFYCSLHHYKKPTCIISCYIWHMTNKPWDIDALSWLLKQNCLNNSASLFWWSLRSTPSALLQGISFLLALKHSLHKEGHFPSALPLNTTGAVWGAV